MYCRKCGNEIPANTDFCIYCGESYNSIEVVSTEEDDGVIDHLDMPSLAPVVFESQIEISTEVKMAEVSTAAVSDEELVFNVDVAPSLKNVLNDNNNGKIETLNVVDSSANNEITSELRDIIKKVTARDTDDDDSPETLAGNDFSKGSGLNNEKYDDRFRVRGAYGLQKEKGLGLILGVFILLLMVGLAVGGVWYQRSLEKPPVVIDDPSHGIEDPIEDPGKDPNIGEQDGASKKIKELVEKGYVHSTSDFIEYKGHDFVIPGGLIYQVSDDWLIVGNVYYKSYVSIVNNSFVYMSNNKIDIEKILVDGGFTVDTIKEYNYNDLIEYLIFKGTYNQVNYELVVSSLNDKESYLSLSFSMLGSFDESYDSIYRIISSTSGNGKGLNDSFVLNDLGDYKEFFYE